MIQNSLITLVYIENWAVYDRITIVMLEATASYIEFEAGVTNSYELSGTFCWVKS